jgi:hypothetical protein
MSRNDDAYCDCYDLADPPDRPEPDRPEAEDAEPRQYRHPYPGDLHPSYDLDLR